MKKVLESTAKVRFQDCDPLNHLNNSKYVDYFVNAREDQILKHYDLDVFAQIKENGKGWVVTSHQIAYIKPAFLSEEVLIESQLINSTGSSVQVEMKMFDALKTTLKAIIWTTFTYFDIKNKKMAVHSEDLENLFKAVVQPIEKQYFEQRCKAILANLKLQ